MRTIALFGMLAAGGVAVNDDAAVDDNFEFFEDSKMASGSSNPVKLKSFKLDNLRVRHIDALSRGFESDFPQQSNWPVSLWYAIHSKAA